MIQADEDGRSSTIQKLARRARQSFIGLKENHADNGICGIDR
jgi:hypothetical protein